MPEYLSPGVYVEEIETGPVPIEGVSTSTAGFVGVTQRGPVDGPPVLITRFADFVRAFGGFLPESFGDSRFLAYAVKGFFDNAGQRVFIKRIPGAGTLSSSAEILDGIVTRLQRGIAAPFTSARLVSQRGLSVGDNVTFQETVNGVVVSETRPITGYNAASGEITWAAPLGRAFTSERTAVISRAPTPPATLRITARDPGRWGDDLRVSFTYTTPARSELAPGVIIPVRALPLTPAFAVTGPAANATSVNLNAGHALVTGDTVEFISAAGSERRRVTVAADTISWTGGLQNDYSAASSIRVVTAVRAGESPLRIHVPAAMTAALQPGDVLTIAGDGRTEDLIIAAGFAPGTSPIEFAAPAGNSYLEGATLTLSGSGAPMSAITATTAFAGAGPASGDVTTTLAAGHTLQTGDTVEFAAGTNTERREVAVATDTLTWTDPLTQDYSGAGSTIRLVTAARAGVTTSINVLAALTTGLHPGDRVTLRGGGVSEQATIDALWPSGTSPIIMAAPAVNSYLEGAVLGLPGLAVMAGRSNTLRVQSSRSFYTGALVELDNGSQREYFTVDAIAGNDLTLSGVPAHNYAAGNFARLSELRLSVRYLNTADRIDDLETFDGLSMDPSLSTKYIVTVVNNGSRFVRLEDLAGPAVPFPNPTTLDGGSMRLSGGEDGAAPDDSAFIGEDLGPGLRTGIEALADIDQISIVAVPGKTSQAIQSALIAHCELLLDRFAVLDPPENATVQSVIQHRNQYDSKYAALYYPWVTILDPLAAANRNVPPSGHVIGIYARVDNTRGVHKAPANEVIRSIVGLERIISKREQDILNPSPTNVNVLRDLTADGRGRRVFGARCATSNALFKYINVRRLFLFLEESIDEGTQFAVFEPNDPKLWARLTQSVTNFLTRVWKDGALFGDQPEQAFFVRCDLSTMTTDDIENGRLIMLIGVAPVKPAEFVIIRITQFPAGSLVEEL